MREIKFRAWDTAKKEWIAKDFHLIGEVMMSGLLFDRSIERLNDITVMQYTGLKDKKGREIYEGDIVQGQKECQAVEHYVGAEGDGYQCAGFFLPADWQEGVEVIGNIYENPELVTK